MNKTLLIAVFLLFCGTSCADDTRPDIVLISVDTLRADYFTPESMPLTYEWAKKNCRIYTNAHSCSTWTKPSHVTMLTGLLPSEHGVERIKDAISPETIMIQERLKTAGYNTFGFASCGHMNKSFGFDRGFDHYWEKYESLTPHTFRQAKKFLLNDRRKGSTFLFVHTFLIHDYFLTVDPPDVPSENKKEIWSWYRNKLSIEEQRKTYQNSVELCDAELYEFIRFLLEYFNDPYIVITSDHGEGLGEKHGDTLSYYHCAPPYLELTHIPLIVYGINPGMTDDLVGTDDIADTILQLAHINPNPSKTFFNAREKVISEYIHRYKSDDMTRHISIIEKDGREMVSIEDNEESDVETPGAEIPEKIVEELRALGYLN